MKPSIGRIVHYVPSGYPDNYCNAAIVTKVNEDGTIGLYCFEPETYSSNYTLASVPETIETTRSQHWHWPERVD